MKEAADRCPLITSALLFNKVPLSIRWWTPTPTNIYPASRGECSTLLGGSRSCATRVKDVKISCCPKTPAGAAGQNRLLLELLKLQQPILYLLYIILQKDTFRLRELFILQLTLQNDVYASMVMYLFKWIELISIDFD